MDARSPSSAPGQQPPAETPSPYPALTAAQRNAIAKALAAKDDRIRELEEEVWALRERLGDKSNDFDSISIRYEDETGHEWDGRAFA